MNHLDQYITMSDGPYPMLKSSDDASMAADFANTLFRLGLIPEKRRTDVTLFALSWLGQEMEDGKS